MKDIKKIIKELGLQDTHTENIIDSLFATRREISRLVAIGEDMPMTFLVMNTHDDEKLIFRPDEVTQDNRDSIAGHVSTVAEMMKANVLFMTGMGWKLPRSYTKDWSEKKWSRFFAEYISVENHPKRQEIAYTTVYTKTKFVAELAQVNRNKKGKGTVGLWQAGLNEIEDYHRTETRFCALINHE